MTTAAIMERFAETSPRFKARLAGALNFFSLLTAGLTETFVRGRLNFVGGYIAIASMVVVTLLLYGIFKPVSRSLSFLAACFAFAGLICEALRLQPQGIDIAIVIHGFYCLLIGYLILRSDFLPRILGGLMAFAALGWLTYLSPSLVNYLSPYNLAAALLAELSLILWLLVMGVNAQHWMKQDGVAVEQRLAAHRA